MLRYAPERCFAQDLAMRMRARIRECSPTGCSRFCFMRLEQMIRPARLLKQAPWSVPHFSKLSPIRVPLATSRPSPSDSCRGLQHPLRHRELPLRLERMSQRQFLERLSISAWLSGY